MAVIAAAIRGSSPAIGVALMAIVLIAALAATGYFIGRRYVNRRLNRRY
jgi:uncharacterized protein YneF (UPF0154 family)